MVNVRSRLLETPLSICPQCGGAWDRRRPSCPGCRLVALDDEPTRLLVQRRAGTSPAAATTVPRILLLGGGAMLAAAAGFGLATALTVRSVPEVAVEPSSPPPAPAVVSATGGLADHLSEPPRVTLRTYENVPAPAAPPSRDEGLPPSEVASAATGLPPDSPGRIGDRPLARPGLAQPMWRPGGSVRYQPPVPAGPEPRAVPQEGEGLLVLRNRSGFPLTVTLIGPASETLRLAAASSLPVSLPQGSYRLTAGGEAGETSAELRLEAGERQALEIEEVLRGEQRGLEVLEPARQP